MPWVITSVVCGVSRDSVSIMPSQARVVWDTAFTRYDFGPMHPMAPIRLDLTARLCEALGVLAAPGVEVVGAEAASDELLATVHDAAYIAAVRAASVDPATADTAYGLGTEDDPAFLGMHEASARVVTGTLESCPGGLDGRGGARRQLLRRPAPRHARCPRRLLRLQRRRGGHPLAARPTAPSGWPTSTSTCTTATVSSEIFWDDPRVLTISVHESGRALFPGTGWPRHRRPRRRG